MVYLEYAWVGAWERKVLWVALCIVYWGLGENVNICSPKIPIIIPIMSVRTTTRNDIRSEMHWKGSCHVGGRAAFPGD
jgi:hypothetical protein